VTTEATDDTAVRDIVARLSRPHASGGWVIERAAIVAEGDRAGALLEWIFDRSGRGEAAAAGRARGLHGARSDAGDGPPVRYVLPPGALDR
jgi:hypothetical protein